MNMKKVFLLSVCLMLFVFFSADSAKAQMMGWQNSGVSQEIYDHTVREEAKGKEIWGKFLDKQTSCSAYTDEDFGSLGEYFMGVMMGSSHANMNAMMAQAHGEDGEEQIHRVMGKRFSGCDTSAIFPAGSIGLMPMMMGGVSPIIGNNVTGTAMHVGLFGWFFMILWWGLIALLIVALIKLLTGKVKDGHLNSMALDILKERYAKGEIDKKEFEAKKKDLLS